MKENGRENKMESKREKATKIYSGKERGKKD